MPAKTTNDMLEALQAADANLRKSRDELSAAMPPGAVAKFGSALLRAGASTPLADEHQGGLDRSLGRIHEALQDLQKEIGSAHHIIAAGVHRAYRNGDAPSRNLDL
jgi:hypothetical protein